MARARFAGRGLTPLQWLLAVPLFLFVLASLIIWAAFFTTFVLIATVLFGVVLIFRSDLRRWVFGLWRTGRMAATGLARRLRAPHEPVSL